MLLVAPVPLSSQGGRGQKRLAPVDVDVDIVDVDRPTKRKKGESSSPQYPIPQPGARKRGREESREEEGVESERKRRREEGGKERVKGKEKKGKEKERRGEEGGEESERGKTRAPGKTLVKAAHGVGAAVAGKLMGSGEEVVGEEVAAECACSWDTYLQGREDKHRKKHVQVATSTAINFLKWNRVVIIEKKKEEGKREKGGEGGSNPPRPRNEQHTLIIWADLLVPVSVWRANLSKVVDLSKVVRVGRVGGDHPRIEVEVENQQQRDELVAKLREVWGGKGANAVKAGREYEVRVSQRILREINNRGKEIKNKGEEGKEEEKKGEEGKKEEGKWQLPKRIARHQQRKQAEGVAVQNAFGPLANIDTEPIEHRERGKGRGRRVRAITINLAGGKARVAELRRVIETGALGVEVIAVQETWLKGEEILTIPGFSYFGNNRAKQGKRGEGGVGVFVAGHLVATRVKEYREQEWVWVKVEVRSGKPLYICSMYGPQEEERREEVEKTYNRLGQQVETLQEKGHILIMGDLNAKIGKGGERVGGAAKGETSPNGSAVVALLEEQKLWSLLDRDSLSSGPTFYSTGGNSTIDHILTSGRLWEEGARARVRRDLEIGSDHIPVEVVVKIGVDRPPRQKQHKRWKVERLERDEVQREFAEGIERGKIEGGVEERWTEWKRRIRESAKKAVGEKGCGGKGRVGWWDQEVAEAVERRRVAFHKVVEAGGGREEWGEYVERRREVRRLVQAKRTRFSTRVGLEIVEAQTVGGKRMWTLLKQIGWHPREKAAGMDINNSKGEPVHTAEEALDAWGTYFEDLGKGPKGEKFNEEHRERVEREVKEWCEKNKKGEEEGEGDSPITLEEVEKAIKLSKNGRAAGSSGIPNELVKAGGVVVAEGLREVFQQCWKEEKTPKQIKKGLICPIYKDGDARDPNNYRGITVTSAVGKLYGRVILGRVQGWCEEWLGEEQAGFRAKRGCEEQRVILAEAVSKANRLKEPLFLAFIDFRKAYDYVWREGLWWKLINKGVDPKALRVLMELYQESPTRVGVGGWKTKLFNIIAGLKQGCVLSPTLFIIFIDDLIAEIKKVCPGYRVGAGLRVALLLFADDLVIMANTQRELQAALEVLDKYCQLWRLQVNLKKCKAVLAGKAKLNGPIKYRGEPMEVVKEFIYLGVPIQGMGGWGGAIKRGIEKAKKRITKLRRILGDRRLPIALRSELVRLVVRGTLEFGLEGIEHKDRKELESVMHQAGTVVLGCNRNTAQVAVRGELGWLSVKNSILKNKVQLVRRAEERVKEKPESLYAKVWTAGWDNPRSTGMAAQAREMKKELVGEEEGDERVSWTVRGEERVRERDGEEWREEGEKKKSLRPYMQAKHAPVREPYLYFLPAKLAAFRFKIKSQTLPVAAFLAKQGKGSGECRMCGGEEDLQHFLLVCRGLEEERDRCLQVAGFDVSQQLFDWLLRSENKVNCSTPEVEWKISEAVYRMWKARLRIVYQGQTGPHISHGETPQPTNPHHTTPHNTTPSSVPPPGSASANSPAPSPPNQDISSIHTKNRAQATVPRVNGSSGPKAVN